ncbi:transmembrane protein 150C isoform X2 [Melanotaenia boesemani]|uniref:transmembrane protein 150C isoform X2 n=1 Tax=Melanotaenia boesemani TaxID=1250792 RepID=UPI001C045EF8|nr:transmembrane protein 150C isoform X2 [Melanotaenia boesemani]
MEERYFMAVYSENITPLSTAEYRRGNGSLYPPFISVAGNFPPASCFFSEVMSLAAFLGFIIGILRYLQLKNRSDKAWLNFVSMLAFCVGCFGMTLVGNFQLFNMLLIHNVGTLMTFGLGTLYCWVQSYITLRANLQNEGRPVAIARFLLSASITLCFILAYALVPFSLMHAARCQWALVMFFLIFIGTFAVEFRHIHLEVVCTNTKNHPISESDTTVFRQHQDQRRDHLEDQLWDRHQDQRQDQLTGQLEEGFLTIQRRDIQGANQSSLFVFYNRVKL